MWNKIKSFFKSILPALKLVLGVVAGGLIVAVVSKCFAKIGKVGQERNWKAIAGNDKEVMVKDKNDKWKVVVLPMNPKTNKRIRKEEIKKIGLSDTIDRGVQIEIKHTGTNRRVGTTTDSDMSI